jgi:hypothetical protein
MRSYVRANSFGDTLADFLKNAHAFMTEEELA